MPAINTATLPELEAALEQGGAQLNAREVHALFLGAMTSTNPRFGPQHLLEQILGDDGPPDDDPPMALIGTILGYWNHLQDERTAGRVHFVPRDLPEGATRAEISDCANCRQHELTLYLRGLAAGGDDPGALGSADQSVLQRIAQVSAYFQGLSMLMDREPFASAEAMVAARDNLILITRTAESILSDLIEKADAVRLAAVRTFATEDRRETPDRMPIRRGPRIGRNEPCPCGSGKKWKRCCGNLATAQ